MSFLKALCIGLAVYLGMLLSVIVLTVLLLLCLWTSLCAFTAIILFFFWMFVSHTPHTLYSSLYMLVCGSPPCVGSYLLGFYYGKLRNCRSVPLVTLRHDAPFSDNCSFQEACDLICTRRLRLHNGPAG